jgi:hypothetical protein
MELVRFNQLFAHLFTTRSQSMSALEIVMQLSFPGIKETDGERTPLVSKHTIGYIHALMIDTVATLTTDPPRARALRNKTMVVEELELNKDVFRSE